MYAHLRLAVALIGVLGIAICAGCPGDDDDTADDDTASDDDTGDDDTADDDSSDDDSAGDDDTAEGCLDTADGVFPPEAVEMAHEPDEGSLTLFDIDWYFQGYQGTYYVGEEKLWQSVRFDLPAPATIHGARVTWGNLTGSDERPVRLGAYDDFGSNGFDFWQWEARWEGDRCLEPGDEGEWVDYVFDTPIEMEIPGLFFIAHLFDPTAEGGGENQPSFQFPNSYIDCVPVVGRPAQLEETHD